ncbi:hypothetical protein Pint_13040 [Pistacia integerrima]|uniref:Uncharacterized protein n=1 Tax=Pistacia integerrima TaxID=434235 RepID=A0ACC0Y7Y3_9ROSI|nr:hypothetical protein Pint_13040 [Pistacia integerrima]
MLQWTFILFGIRSRQVLFAWLTSPLMINLQMLLQSRRLIQNFSLSKSRLASY